MLMKQLNIETVSRTRHTECPTNLDIGKNSLTFSTIPLSENSPKMRLPSDNYSPGLPLPLRITDEILFSLFYRSQIDPEEKRELDGLFPCTVSLYSSETALMCTLIPPERNGFQLPANTDKEICIQTLFETAATYGESSPGYFVGVMDSGTMRLCLVAILFPMFSIFDASFSVVQIPQLSPDNDGYAQLAEEAEALLNLCKLPLPQRMKKILQQNRIVEQQCFHQTRSQQQSDIQQQPQETRTQKQEHQLQKQAQQIQQLLQIQKQYLRQQQDLFRLQHYQLQIQQYEQQLFLYLWQFQGQYHKCGLHQQQLLQFYLWKVQEKQHQRQQIEQQYHELWNRQTKLQQLQRDIQNNTLRQYQQLQQPMNTLQMQSGHRNAGRMRDNIEKVEKWRLQKWDMMQKGHLINFSQGQVQLHSITFHTDESQAYPEELWKRSTDKPEVGIRNLGFRNVALDSVTMQLSQVANVRSIPSKGRLLNSRMCVTIGLFHPTTYEIDSEGGFFVQEKSNLQENREGAKVEGEVKMSFSPEIQVGGKKRLSGTSFRTVRGGFALQSVLARMENSRKLRVWFLSKILTGMIWTSGESKANGFVPGNVERKKNGLILDKTMPGWYFEELGGTIFSLGGKVYFRPYSTAMVKRVGGIDGNGRVRVTEEEVDNRICKRNDVTYWDLEELEIGLWG